MIHWWERDVIDGGKLPLMLCLIAYILTFIITRTVTRRIRAGKGPFRDVVTSGGVHVHHSVPGLALLVVGAFTSLGAQSDFWWYISAVMIGIGVSLVLDEFALILHLSDQYWTAEGRVSVDLVCLSGACLMLALVGFSPIGVDDVGGTELAVRLGTMVVLIGHGLLILWCVLKGKYYVALLGAFLPPIALVGAIRLAKPGSIWARRFYSPGRCEAAAARQACPPTTLGSRASPVAEPGRRSALEPTGRRCDIGQIGKFRQTATRATNRALR